MRASRICGPPRRCWRGARPSTPGLVSPGSLDVKRRAEEEGLDRIFREAGLEWVDSGCSMCVAMNGDIVPAGERCASTTNRNFKGRQGPGARTHLMSPAMAAAAAVTGRSDGCARCCSRARLRRRAWNRSRRSNTPAIPLPLRQCRHRPAHSRALPQAVARGGLRAVPAPRPSPRCERGAARQSARRSAPRPAPP